MKKVEDIKKYREMKVEQLEASLLDLKKGIISDSLKIKAGKANNFAIIEKSRKSIARIKTIISEKGLE